VLIPVVHSPSAVPTGAQPELRPLADPDPASPARAPVVSTIRQLPSAVCRPEASTVPRCRATRAVNVSPSSQAYVRSRTTRPPDGLNETTWSENEPLVQPGIPEAVNVPTGGWWLPANTVSSWITASAGASAVAEAAPRRAETTTTSRPTILAAPSCSLCTSCSFSSALGVLREHEEPTISRSSGGRIRLSRGRTNQWSSGSSDRSRPATVSES
jgi:hypothetical protein